MPQRDQESKIRVNGIDTISIVAASAPYEVAGTEVDTAGFRTVTFAAEPAEAIGTDELYIKIYESDTSGGTYTEIASDKYLPTTGAEALTDAGATGIVKRGCFSTKRYIKPYIDADVVADDLDVNVIGIFVTEDKPEDENGIDTLP